MPSVALVSVRFGSRTVWVIRSVGPTSCTALPRRAEPSVVVRSTARNVLDARLVILSLRRQHDTSDGRLTGMQVAG